MGSGAILRKATSKEVKTIRIISVPWCVFATFEKRENPIGKQRFAMMQKCIAKTLQTLLDFNHFECRTGKWCQKDKENH